MLVAKLSESAKLPTRKNPEDAGLDFYSNEDRVIPPLCSAILRTGITIKLDKGKVGLLKPKSKNLHILGAGVIDAGYQGEILVKVINYNSSITLMINVGEAIAQMLIFDVDTPAVIEVSKEVIHKEKTARGNTGGIVTLYSEFEPYEYDPETDK